MVDGESESSAPVGDPGEIVIGCNDEASARNEVAQRQALEVYGATWTYFRAQGRWVVKRFPQMEGKPKKQGWKQVVGEVAGDILNPLNWFS